MSARHRASAILEAGDEATASAVAAALAVEAADPPPGTRIRVVVEDSRVALDIDAADVSGLRAAFSGMMRLAVAATETAGA